MGSRKSNKLVKGRGRPDTSGGLQRLANDSFFSRRVRSGADHQVSDLGRVSTRGFSGLLFDSQLLTERR